MAWQATRAPEGGERHEAQVFHDGREVGELKLRRLGAGTGASDAWPDRVWRDGRYERGFYEWFYEGWYVALRRPPLLLESARFDVTLDPTLGLEARAVLAALRSLAAPGSAVVGPALGLLPPEERARAKAEGLVAWASRVSSRIYAGALIVAAADDVAGSRS